MHETPPFYGGNSLPTVPEWLQQFEKVAKYHQYTDGEKLLEFTMAVRGDDN